MSGVTLLITCLVWHVSFASYRHMSLSSPDLCLPSQRLSLTPALMKTIELDKDTAAILTLQANNGKVPFSKCDLSLKSSPGHGLMVRVETGQLRSSSIRVGKCIDYIQMGIDDSTPFYTWTKSNKLCGNFSGFSYNDDNGRVLLWLRLGQWDNLDTQESVHVSLIVTQYKIGNFPKYRSCQTGKQWILQQYFCDGRVNCAKDSNPADEDAAFCKDGSFQPGMPTTSTNLPAGPPLNLLSITLILVSSVVIVFLFCLLIVRLKSRSCFHSHPSNSNSCELPENMVANHAILTSTTPAVSQQTRQPPIETQYLDLSSRSLLRGSTPDNEPPPAYNDLFPPGYKFPQKFEEVTETVIDAPNDENTKEQTSESVINREDSESQNVDVLDSPEN